jgi:hypothetical protein
MNLRFIIFASLALSLVACANQPADEVQNSSSADAIEVPGEKLLAAPPAGWNTIYSLNNGITRLTDFVPAAESVSDWSTKLSFESHQTLADVDPISIIMGELDSTSDTCEPIESFNLFSGDENNYPTSVRITFCGENAHSGLGEVSISKVIQGNDFLYIIKLLNRRPTFTDSDHAMPKTEIAAWAQYFSEITLCDETRAAHPCLTPTDE